MAEIIKIPSKYIYDKKVNELAGNKVQAVEIQAKDISEISVEKQVADIEKSPDLNIGIVNSYVSESNPYDLKQDFKGEYFAEQSWALKLKNQRISGIASNGFENSDENLVDDFYLEIPYYCEYYDIPIQQISFRVTPPIHNLQNRVTEAIKFVSNGETFYGISLSTIAILYWRNSPLSDTPDVVNVYYGGAWSNTNYQDIDFQYSPNELYQGISPEFADVLSYTTTNYTLTTKKIAELKQINIENGYWYTDSYKGDILIYNDNQKQWTNGYNFFKNLNFYENTIISQSGISFFEKYFTKNFTISEGIGYVSQYTYAGLKNYHQQLNFIIPIEDSEDKIEEIFNYPDMETTAIYNHYQYSTNIMADYIGTNNSITNTTGYGAYTISDFTATELISSEKELSTSLLSDEVDGYSLESEMGQVKRPDDISAGQDILAKISLPKLQNFNSAKIVTIDGGSHLSVNVLCGVLATKGNISANEIDNPLTEDDLSNADGYARYLSSDKGILDVYEVTKLRIVFKGKVLTLDIQDETLTFGETESSDFSLKDNELMQTTNKTDGVNSLYNLGNAIINSYAQGKETVSLVCGVTKYYDLSGNKILIDPTNENPDLPMIIPNNSIIMPYVSIMSSNGKLMNVPLSTNSQGTPKSFLVVGSELEFDGVIRQILYGIEIFVPYFTNYYTEENSSGGLTYYIASNQYTAVNGEYNIGEI